MKKNDDWIDEPVRREKENMDEPQEEFISDEPPSKTKAEEPKPPLAEEKES